MADEDTVPVNEEFFATVTHNGRMYQQFAIENHQYFEPIDEDEVDRLELLHRVLSKVLHGRLLPSELSRPRRVLECGVGPGYWAMEVARAYPTCEVVAVDIAPHVLPLEEDLPENLVLQVDNVNERFTWHRNEFDLVHSQMMVGAVNADRWRSYIRDIYRTLRPGGWCQMVEIYFNAQSDNGTLTDDHGLRRWSRLYMESIQPYKDPRAPLRIANWMREAGFVVAREPRPMPLPTCGWPKDQNQHDVGILNRNNVRGFLSSLAMYPMTVLQGMDPAEFELLVAQARSEADNPGFKWLYRRISPYTYARVRNLAETPVGFWLTLRWHAETEVKLQQWTLNQERSDHATRQRTKRRRDGEPWAQGRLGRRHRY